MRKLCYLLLFLGLSLSAQNRNAQLINQSKSIGNFRGDTYILNPASAGIVQGVVTDAQARTNVDIMNTEIQAAVSGGYSVFQLPVMDAYFETVDATNGDPEIARGQGSKFQNHDEAIKIPSNMHFKMDVNTVLRAQPNKFQRFALLSMNYQDNVTISGGQLVGDKAAHTYAQYYTVSSAATTTTATVEVQREFVATVYAITVTVSNATTNATEIAAYLDAIGDLTASSSGTEITLSGNAGVYVELSDDSSDASNIAFTGHNSHEYGYGIQLFGVHDSFITNVVSKDWTGDGLFVGITGLRNTDGSIPARTFTETATDIKAVEGVLVSGCTFDNNRRQGVSIVDCTSITLDNNTVTNTGKDIYAPPGYGIDMEAYRLFGAEYARIENVVVSNNNFAGNKKGDIDIYNPQDTEIYSNTFEYKVDNVAGQRISIHDNTFTGLGPAKEVAIGMNTFLSGTTGLNLVNGIDIYNNNISGGYTYGISVSGEDFNVYNNTVTNCVNAGILLNSGGLKNASFYDNVVTSNVSSTGIKSFIGTPPMENVTINNDSYSVPTGFGADLSDIIGATYGNGLTVTNTTFSGTTTPYSDIRVRDSENIYFGAGNTYTTTDESTNTNVVFYGSAVDAVFWADVYPNAVGDPNVPNYDHINKEAVESRIATINPDVLIYGGDVYPFGTKEQLEHIFDPYQTWIDNETLYYTPGDHELSDTQIATSDLTMGTSIFTASASWNYLELPNGNAFPTDWKLLAFDDTAWTAAAGNFGFGTPGSGTADAVTINTTLTSGLQNYLFRKVVDGTDITSNGLVIETSITDGAEIYVNGTLVHSFNMYYPITNASTALSDILPLRPDGWNDLGEGAPQVIRIPASYFKLFEDNQVAVLLKPYTTSDTALHFEMALSNYTFPDVGLLTSPTFHDTGLGSGWTEVMPYLDDNGDMTKLSVANVDYFIIKSGYNDQNQLATPNGIGANSRTADWLKTEVAASTADLKVLVTHQGVVSWVVGSKNQPYFSHIFDDPTTYDIDIMLVGDSHVSEAFVHNPSGIKVYNSSQHKGDSSDVPDSYHLANIYDQTGDSSMGSQVAVKDWTTLYYSQVALDDQFIYIKSINNVVTLEYLDKDGNVNYTETLFTPQ